MPDPDPRETAERIAAALSGFRFVVRDEAQLQEAIAEVLSRNGYHVRREAWIGIGCRADLVVGRVAVEVKVAGSAAEVARQIRRYLAAGGVDRVVLVTRKVAHLNVPHLLDDDRVHVLALPLRGL